jgi:DNA helicase II / ATP-dependent DNA helicase PcrA
MQTNVQRGAQPDLPRQSVVSTARNWSSIQSGSPQIPRPPAQGTVGAVESVPLGLTGSGCSCGSSGSSIMSPTIPSSVLTEGLNVQQAAAVTTAHRGATLVLAGAGCGKTTVLARRVAHCAQHVCEQKRILALTFTRKAATEMLDRVKQTPGIDTAGPLPMITTFHGFGLRVLRGSLFGQRNFDRLGYRGNLSLVSESERYRLLADASTVAERQMLGVDVMRLDVLLAQQAVHPQKLARLSPDKLTVLRAVEERVSRRKQERGLWDFSDIISDVTRLLEQFPRVRTFYTAYFRVILVDEFQDTNPLQVSLLRLLGTDGNRFFAVGDDDQAIYGFRGADITPISTFTDVFPGAQILKLETNYRSTPAVLRAANRIFRGKPAQYRKVLRSGRYAIRQPSGKRWPAPSKHRFDTQAEAAVWILQRSREISAKEGIALRDMALLFRINQTLDWAAVFFGGMAIAPNERPQLLTVHGSKGLEFPVVFLCDLEEEVFPSYRRTAARRWRSVRDVLQWFFLGRKPLPDDCDLDEEKRLFYVGVTRAEKYLFLISIAQKEHYGRIRKYRRSRFLGLV